MKRQSTIKKINSLLNTNDYLGIPRGKILNLQMDNNEEYFGAISFLLRHKIIIKAGDRYIINY